MVPQISSPPPQIPSPPPLIRQWNQGERFAYHVSVALEGSGPTVTFEYDLIVRVAKVLGSEGSEIRLDFGNASIRTEGKVARTRKLGGAPFPVVDTGLIKGLDLSQQSRALAAPLLAFYLPDSAAPDDTFAEKGLPVEPSAVLSGKGSYVHPKPKEWTIVLELALRQKGAAEGSPNLGRYSGTSLFGERGILVRSEGTLVAPDGTATFKIRRRG